MQGMSLCARHLSLAWKVVRVVGKVCGCRYGVRQTGGSARGVGAGSQQRMVFPVPSCHASERCKGGAAQAQGGAARSIVWGRGKAGSRRAGEAPAVRGRR